MSRGRFTGLILLLVLSSHLHAQRDMYKRKNRDAFPDPMQYKMSGWHFDPGLTYMLTRFDEPERITGDDLKVKLDPAGGIRPYLGFGRYHILEYSTIFKYLDYGVAYKWLGGNEAFQIENGPGAKSRFNDHFVSAYFNLNNIIQISDYNFIQNTIGLNVDYLFWGNRKPGGDIPGLEPVFPGSFVASIHYKIGYGIKANQDLMIIPSLETSVLNFLPFEWGRSSLPYYHSRYRPLILSVRFMFLRPIRLKSCKPVRNPDLPGGVVIPDGMEH